MNIDKNVSHHLSQPMTDAKKIPTTLTDPFHRSARNCGRKPDCLFRWRTGSDAELYCAWRNTTRSNNVINDGWCGDNLKLLMDIFNFSLFSFSHTTSMENFRFHGFGTQCPSISIMNNSRWRVVVRVIRSSYDEWKRRISQIIRALRIIN